jgi:hypothetical protein
MKQALLSLFILLVSISNLHATDNYPVGARSAALGNASVTFGDVWSTMHNQAGLGFLKNISAGIYFENKFNVSGLALESFAIGIPVKKSGAFGVSATQYGYSQYNEKKVGICYAKKFGEKISFGVQMDYLSVFFNDDYYGTHNAFAAEAGIIAEPLKNFKVGAHIFNLSKAKIAEYADERIPVIARFGASYKFSEKVLLSIEEEKDIDMDAVFKAGLEYHIIEQLFLRVGIASNPSLSCFGFGLKLGHFALDASASYHQVLGFTPQLGLAYDFN